ncbi:MAG: hypothetical protein FH753_18725 [Firmicutes bacterium]|nr:hypothetical protein [Bacillota bacterium]
MTFLDQDINKIINKANESDKKTIKAYLTMLKNPKSVGEFMDKFKKAVNDNTSKQMLGFKIIERSNEPRFFSYVLDTIKDLDNNIQVQTAFKSLKILPEDINIINKYLSTIIKLIDKIRDREVIYHGVCLLYRAEKKHPSLKETIKNYNITLTEEEGHKLLRKFDIQEKWATKNHRGKTKPGYIQSMDDFVSFSQNFITY